MFGNWCKETSSTAGTGTLTLVAVANFPRFSSVFADGDYVSYAILDSNGAPLEAGIGRYVATNTLERTRPTATYTASTYNNATPTALSLTGTNTIIATAIAGTFSGASPSVDGISTGVSRYIWSPHLEIATNGKILTADRCFYIPFRMDFGGIVDAFAVNVTAAVAGNIRVGLYRCTPSGYMGAKIVESADISTTATGEKVATFAARFLPPGWYFTAISAKGIAPTVVAGGGGSSANIRQPTPLGATGFPAAATLIIWRYQDLTAAWTNLPATPAAVTTAETVNADFAPLIVLRAA